MRSPLGSIAQLWRYPVKSMAGERLARCAVGPGGLAGDRGWAVRDEQAGEIRGAKQIPKLLMCAARYLEEPDGAQIPHVQITLPDGGSFCTDEPDAGEQLSAFLGRPVTLRSLRPASDGDHFDVGPYHLLTTAALDALAAMLPGARIEVRRFRPNLLVRTPPGMAGFVEHEWSGAALRIGDVPMTAGVPVPRCGMTAAAQPGLPKDPTILRTIVREVAQMLGIYASTDATGTIEVDDAVERR